MGGLYVVVDLDVVEFGAADNAFLLFGGQRLPRGKVVQVFLHDNITAVPEIRFGVADQRRGRRGAPRGVLRTVDESQQVPGVEIPESGDMVLHLSLIHISEPTR